MQNQGSYRVRLVAEKEFKKLQLCKERVSMEKIVKTWRCKTNYARNVIFIIILCIILCIQLLIFYNFFIGPFEIDGQGIIELQNSGNSFHGLYYKGGKIFFKISANIYTLAEYNIDESLTTHEKELIQQCNTIYLIDENGNVVTSVIPTAQAENNGFFFLRPIEDVAFLQSTISSFQYAPTGTNMRPLKNVNVQQITFFNQRFLNLLVRLLNILVTVISVILLVICCRKFKYYGNVK